MTVNCNDTAHYSIGNGSSDYSFNWTPASDGSDVKVALWDSTAKEYQEYTQFTVSGNTITITENPLPSIPQSQITLPSGELAGPLVIYRSTSLDGMPSFQAGSTIRAGDLNTVVTTLKKKVEELDCDAKKETLTAEERAKLSGVQPNATANPATVAFSDVTSTPTTLAGYGITDSLATGAQGALADSALQPSDIGTTVQGFNSNIVIDANYQSTANDFTDALKLKVDNIDQVFTQAEKTAVANIASSISTAIGNSVLDDLSNVSVTNPGTGYFLKWDGSQWVDSPDNNTTYSDFTAGTAGLVPSGSSASQVLYGSGWGSLPTIPSVLNDLTNVSVSNPANNSYLRYSNNQWVADNTVQNINLDDLQNVSAANATNGEVLKYVNGQWQAEAEDNPNPMTAATSTTAGASGLTPTAAAGSENYFLRGDATWAPASLNTDSSPQLIADLDANGNDIDMGTNTITDTKVGQWDTAYGWGDHSQANYKRYEFGTYDSDWANGEVDETFVVTYEQQNSAEFYRETGIRPNYVVCINGEQKPTLYLKPRGIYKFDLSSATLSGRFFEFYAARDTAFGIIQQASVNRLTASSSDSADIKVLSESGRGINGLSGASGSHVTVLITENTPMIFHYNVREWNNDYPEWKGSGIIHNANPVVLKSDPYPTLQNNLLTAGHDINIQGSGSLIAGGETFDSDRMQKLAVNADRYETEFPVDTYLQNPTHTFNLTLDWDNDADRVLNIGTGFSHPDGVNLLIDGECAPLIKVRKGDLIRLNIDFTNWQTLDTESNDDAFGGNANNYPNIGIFNENPNAKGSEGFGPWPTLVSPFGTDDEYPSAFSLTRLGSTSNWMRRVWWNSKGPQTLRSSLSSPPSVGNYIDIFIDDNTPRCFYLGAYNDQGTALAQYHIIKRAWATVLVEDSEIALVNERFPALQRAQLTVDRHSKIRFYEAPQTENQRITVEEASGYDNEIEEDYVEVDHVLARKLERSARHFQGHHKNIAPSLSNVDQTFKVTIGTRTNRSRFGDTTSTSVLLIDGDECPDLHLKPGGWYEFDTSDSSISSWITANGWDEARFTFYTEPYNNRTSSDRFLSTSSGANALMSTANSEVVIRIPVDTPPILYYDLRPTRINPATTEENLGFGGFIYTGGNAFPAANSSSYADSDVDTHLNTSSAGANEILSWTGTDYDWVTAPTNGTDGADGADGAGFTGGSYDSTTGIVTFTSNDNLGFSTGDLRGADGTDGTNGTNGTNGTDGDGWTGGSYNSSTGIVTFTSNDGLGFSTGDLRGADGTNGTDGTDGTNGVDGDGWTGGSYDSSTGVVTFTSNDGLGFATGDLRGADGTDGTNGTNGTNGVDGADGADGTQIYHQTTQPSSANNGDFWIDSDSTNKTLYKLISGTWTSQFDMQGSDGADGADGTNGTNGTNGADGADGADGNGWTGGSYNPSTGIVTFTSNDNLGFSTGDLRGADGADGTNGTNGTDGADGNAATISVGTITTGAAGSNANVTNSGTSSAAVLDFTIPRGDAGLSNVSADTTPQLGGDLDVQTRKITTSTSNGNIKLEPNGTGKVEIRGDGASEDGKIQLNCSNNSHGVTIQSPAHSAAATYTLTLPTSAGSNKDVLETNGSGVLAWTSDVVRLTDTQTLTNKTLTLPTIDGFIEDLDNAHVTVSNTQLYFGSGTNGVYNGCTYVGMTSGGGATFDFGNMLDGEQISLMIYTGSGTVTWSNIARWVNGSAPTLTSNAWHAFEFWKFGSSGASNVVPIGVNAMHIGALS